MLFRSQAAGERGVRILALNELECRLVTHLDVSAEQAQEAASILAEVTEELAAAAG